MLPTNLRVGFFLVNLQLDRKRDNSLPTQHGALLKKFELIVRFEPCCVGMESFQVHFQVFASIFGYGAILFGVEVVDNGSDLDVPGATGLQTEYRVVDASQSGSSN